VSVKAGQPHPGGGARAEPARGPRWAALLAGRMPARVGGARGGSRIARRRPLPRTQGLQAGHRAGRGLRGGRGLADLLLGGGGGLCRARRRTARPPGGRG